MSTPKKFMILQYGDYKEAMRAQQAGRPEVYRAQYYSLDAVDEMIGDGSAIIVGLDTEPHDVSEGRYRFVGDRFMPSGGGILYTLKAMWAARRLIRIVAEEMPTHMIIRTPGWVLARVGGWAISHGISVLPLLADYFPTEGLRQKMRLKAQVEVLNDLSVPVVANHNYPACNTLVEAGVDAHKVVPWDWPPERTPAEEKTKTAPANTIRLLYAGALLENKGVGDLIRAHAMLCESGMNVFVECYGDGKDKVKLQQLAESSGAGKQFLFHGLASNIHVLERMKKAHLVIVPSRHEYPEGLPNVLYEAFETRTPVVCSDHPTFMKRLVSGTGCMIFSAGSAEQLASAVRAVISSETYAALSESTLQAWESIQCPVTFKDILLEWVNWTTNSKPLPCLNHSVANTENGEA